MQINFLANPYLLPDEIVTGRGTTHEQEVRSGRDRVTSAEPLRKCLLVTCRMSRAARYRASRQTIISLSSSYYASKLRDLRIEMSEIMKTRCNRVYKNSVFAIARSWPHEHPGFL